MRWVNGLEETKIARILIVDDNNFDLEFISDVIQKYAKERYESEWSLRITKAKDAIEALEVMKEHAFELVITDIRMAKVDGWQLIKEIRKDKNHSELPIVVVSAIDGVELNYKSKLAGASLWFTKPIRPKDFTEKVFNLIAER
jgi:CheY-like chemotaxis protein